MIRAAINGFGRIGRQLLQAGITEPDIEWVAINDLTSPQILAHLLKYDSAQGKFPGTVTYTSDSVVVNGKAIKVFAEKDPEKLPWKALNIDIVLESTGIFTERDGALKHIKAGAKKVLISAPSKDPDITLVMGVNEHLYDKTKHHIVSNASCTTNCLAPMVKVLHDNFRIKKGFMTTVHAFTADQRLVDAPHKDLRRARAASVNIIPTTTGAARTVAEVIPSLKGKLDGLALRVPVPAGSLTDFVCELEKPVTKEHLNWLFSQVAQFHLKGILEFSDEPIVSSDIVHNSHSCIFDSLSTMVMDGTFVKIIGWYDNEWGYSCRMIDILKKMMA
jgi:glyceraldehyde 3-phosphate dehydrogenase